MFGNKCCCGRQGFGFGQMGNQQMMNSQMCENQVVEPTITKCVEQEFFHEVPHECMKSETHIAHIDTKRLKSFFNL